MLRKCLLAAVLVLCYGSVFLFAEVPGDVLRQCRRACGNCSTNVTLRAEGGLWQPHGIALWKVEVNDADLRSLATLPALKMLEISTIWSGHGKVTPRGIEKLRAFQQLRRLSLHMRLPENSLETIRSLKQLEDLELHWCEGLSDGEFVYLRDLPKLRRLRLRHVDVTDAALVHIGQMEALERLGLEDNVGITDGGLVHLMGLKNLRSLDVSGTQVTARGLSAMRNLPRLEHLALSEHCATADLGSWSRLRWLNAMCVATEAQVLPVRLPEGLPRLGISAESGVPQQPLPHLKTLTVGHYSGGLVDAQWLRSLPSLRELDMEGQLGRMLEAIGGLRALRTLTLFDCMKPLTDEGLKQIAELRQLESLTLRVSAWSVTDKGMTALGHLARLRELELDPLHGVTSEGLACLGKLERLRSLTLGLVEGRPPGGAIGRIAAHVAGLKQLEELSIHGTAVTDDALQQLADLKALRRLDLTGCHGFTDEGLAALMEALPNLEEVVRSHKAESRDSNIE